MAGNSSSAVPAVALSVGFPLLNQKEARLPEADTNQLDGQYCALERLSPHHASALYHALHTDTAQHDTTYLGYDLTHERKLKEWIDNVCHASDPYFYAITDASAYPLGVAAYLNITPTHNRIEVGHLHYGPALQRTRMATEAMYLMMRYAFDTLGYRRYEWKCDSLNARSCRAAIRLGFRFEGIFHQHMVYKGRNRDTAWYALLDREWPLQRATFKAWLQRNNFDAHAQQRRTLAQCRTDILNRTIYHLCRDDEWYGQNGDYKGSSQDKVDGFIHLSTREQVINSAAKHRAGQDRLLLLWVDETALYPDTLCYEQSTSQALYPHIYGHLPKHAVLRIDPLPLDQNGTHQFPDDFFAPNS